MRIEFGHEPIKYCNSIAYRTLIYGDDMAQDLDVSTFSGSRGEKNPFKGHGGKFSPWSPKFVAYDGDESLAVACQKKTKSIRKSKSNNNSTLEFYTSRGMTEDEAREALSIRQSTFSLKSCISRHGDDGYRIWKERQEKWQATLLAKPPEELQEIYRKKVDYSISVGERELTKLLRDSGLQVETQLYLRGSSGGRMFDIFIGKKIIEYNGDFWHMNPARYRSDDKNRAGGYQASLVWKYDEEKKKLAESYGYEVRYVWESDFKADKARALQEILEWLKNS